MQESLPAARSNPRLITACASGQVSPVAHAVKAACSHTVAYHVPLLVHGMLPLVFFVFT